MGFWEDKTIAVFIKGDRFNIYMVAENNSVIVFAGAYQAGMGFTSEAKARNRIAAAFPNLKYPPVVVPNGTASADMVGAVIDGEPQRLTKTAPDPIPLMPYLDQEDL